MMLLQAARAVEPLICLASTQSSDVQTKHYCIALSVASLVSDLGTSRHGKLTTAASFEIPGHCTFTTKWRTYFRTERLAQLLQRAYR